MFLSFSTDVYVIFCYWNILMKCTHFIFICHLLMLTYFLCGKYSTISILLLIIYWCWLFFHVQNVLIILNWCLCDFLLLKHIDEVSTHFIFICHLLMLTYFLCGKYSTISILLLIIYWCWLFFHVQNVLIILDWCLCDFLLLKHIDEVDALHLHLSYIAFDNLLMLTIFHVQNVLTIFV